MSAESPQLQVETDITYVISDINNRIRNLENKYQLFGERLLVVNQNMIEEYKDLIKEIKVLEDDMKEIKKEMFKVKDVIGNLVKEMQQFAKKDQIKVLEKYIELWNPVEFMTKEEVEKMINEKISIKSRKGVKKW